jgi:hypothetical protein
VGKLATVAVDDPFDDPDLFGNSGTRHSQKRHPSMGFAGVIYQFAEVRVEGDNDTLLVNC